MNISPDDLMQQAGSAYAENRLEDCGRLCAQALGELPDHVPALVLAGIVRFKGTEPSEGIAYFQKAVSLDGNCTPAYLWLSMTLQKVGRLDEAVEQAKVAARLGPGDPMIQHQLGQCLLQLGNAEDAVIPLEKAAAMAPQVALPHLTLGLALKELKMPDAAIRELRKALRLDPRSMDAWTALRHALMGQMDSAGAAEAARAIVSLEPESAQANLWMAQSLLEDNRGAEAEPYLAKAIELNPETPEAHFLLGSLHQVNGRLDEATAQFQASIDLNSTQGSAYLALVSNKKITEADRPLVEKMRQLLQDPSLTDFSKSELCYALGKSYENLADYPASMRFYDDANKLAYHFKYGDKHFDRKESESALQMTMDRMDREFLEKNGSAGSPDATPIFVVGMIRSGTTLAEQILSAHPQVGATGEQSFWLEHAGAFTVRNKTVDANLLAKFCGRYLELLHSIAPGKDRAVDKMPMNYMVIGLLKVAYPNAKIIHIQRHPIDTCLSIYVTPNRARMAWAHSKTNIAFHYKQYQRLMDHWRTVLSPGDLLEIRYEELVADLETNARAMIDFCGLDWNDACLRPQDNERSVVTPSVWQVRQPVYKTSVARWKRYQGLLGPIEALE